MSRETEKKRRFIARADALAHVERALGPNGLASLAELMLRALPCVWEDAANVTEDEWIEALESLNGGPAHPANWPRCPGCGLPAMDGHITCGERDCDEAGRR